MTDSSRNRGMSAGREQLEVGDVVPRIAHPVGRPGGLDRVERIPDGAVPDRVDVDLESGAVERRRELPERGRLQGRLAAVAGAVRVRLEQRGRARLEHAVGEDLDRGRRRRFPAYLARKRGEPRHLRRPLARVVVQRGEHPRGQPPLRVERAVGVEFLLLRVGLDERRDAEPVGDRSASASPSACSFGPRAGRCFSTSSTASSRSVPLGSPVAGSRSMRPFGGLGVALVTPAIARAFELTQAECPSAEERKAGRSGRISSSRAFDGLPSGKSVRSQPPPRTHGESGCAAA